MILLELLSTIALAVILMIGYSAVRKSYFTEAHPRMGKALNAFGASVRTVANVTIGILFVKFVFQPYADMAAWEWVILGVVVTALWYIYIWNSRKPKRPAPTS